MSTLVGKTIQLEPKQKDPARFDVQNFVAGHVVGVLFSGACREVELHRLSVGTWNVLASHPFLLSPGMHLRWPQLRDSQRVTMYPGVGASIGVRNTGPKATTFSVVFELLTARERLLSDGGPFDRGY